jgi:hypothetical protein
MVSLKHVGRFVTNGKKCLVAYRTLPGDAFNCLVIPTENLPDSYHDALIQLVESSAAQNSGEFAEVLARAPFPDGSIMLAALHTKGHLKKIPTDQVEMIPNFQTRVKLSELNAAIAQQLGVAIDDLAIKDPSSTKNPNVEVREVATVREIPTEKADVTKTTSTSVNETAPTSFDSIQSEAKFYRSQADRLAKQAAEFRRKAEELVPTKKK